MRLVFVEGSVVIGFVRALRFALFIAAGSALGSAVWIGQPGVATAEPAPAVELSLEWVSASDNGNGTYSNLFDVRLTNASQSVLWDLDLTLVAAKPHIDLATGSVLSVDVIGPDETLSLSWSIDSPELEHRLLGKAEPGSGRSPGSHPHRRGRRRGRRPA
jgi:hypothetical protein